MKRLTAILLALVMAVGLMTSLPMSAADDGHVHTDTEYWNHDDEVHYKYCPDCGEHYGYEPHDIAFGRCRVCDFGINSVDLSSIILSDYIGMPVDEAIASFEELFGEGCVTEDTLNGQPVYVVDAMGGIGLAFTVKNGAVYSFDQKWISSALVNSPQSAENLPYSISFADLEKLIASGIYNVKVYERNQKGWTGIDEAKNMSVYFFVGDVAIIYYYSNYSASTDPETGKTDAYLYSEEEMNTYTSSSLIMLNDRDYSNISLADVIGKTTEQAMAQLSEWFGADNVTLGAPMFPYNDITESIVVNILFLGNSWPSTMYFDVKNGIVSNTSGSLGLGLINVPNTIDDWPITMTVSELLTRIENTNYTYRLESYSESSWTGLDGAMNYTYYIYAGNVRVQYAYQNYSQIYNSITSEFTSWLLTDDEIMSSETSGTLSIADDLPPNYTNANLYELIGKNQEEALAMLNEWFPEGLTVNIGQPYGIYPDYMVSVTVKPKNYNSYLYFHLSFQIGVVRELYFDSKYPMGDYMFPPKLTDGWDGLSWEDLVRLMNDPSSPVESLGGMGDENGSTGIYQIVDGGYKIIYHTRNYREVWNGTAWVRQMLPEGEHFTYVSSVSSNTTSYTKDGVELIVDDETGYIIDAYIADDVTSIVIPEMVNAFVTVKGIEEGVFEGENIEMITIPETVEYIAAGSFINCPNLSTIRFQGTEEQWEDIVGDGNVIPDDVDVKFPSDVLPGDLNNDGKINSTDSVLLLRYLAGFKDSNVVVEAADYNSDGSINSLDSVLLLRRLAGLS